MKDTQKRFLGAVLAASSVAGIVAPSVTAMATVVEDESKATADQLRAVINEYSVKLEANPIFANYHRVQYAAERLAQYDAAEAETVKASIAKYADKVFTEEVKTIVDKMDGFASSKSMATYDELVTKDIKAMENKENAEYLMGRLDVWGKAIVFEVDPNYVVATDAIIKVADLRKAGKLDEAQKQVDVAKKAIKEIKTYAVNGAYLEASLKVEIDAIENEIANQDLHVTSVVANNGREVEVKFNKAVSKDSAEKVENYEFATANSDAKTIEVKSNDDDGAELQDDNKTVILTLKDGVTLNNKTNAKYLVKVQDVVTDDDKEMKEFSEIVSLFDNVKPEVTGVEYPDSDTVRVNFSEPINAADGAAVASTVKVKLNGATVSVKSSAFELDEDNLYFEISKSAANLEEDKTYSIEVDGLVDYASNALTKFTGDINFKKDDVDPQVEKVEVLSKNALKVTFDEKVKIDTIKVDNVDGKVVTVEHDDKEDPDHKTFILKVADKIEGNAIVTIHGFKDFAGNTGDSITKEVNFEESHPVLENTTPEYKTIGKDKYAVYSFDRDVKVANLDVKVKHVDSDGVTKEDPATLHDSEELDSLESNEIAVKISDLEEAKYNFDLEKVNVVDMYTQNVEKINLQFTKSANGAKADVTGFTKNIQIGTDQSKKNKIKVTFNQDLGKSALDASKYTVDGVQVFEKAELKENKQTLELTLKDGAIKTSGQKMFAVTGVDGVKDFNDNVIKGAKIEFVENERPVIDKAEVISYDTIKLTMSEDVKDFTGKPLEVKVNGNKVKKDIVVTGKGTDTLVIKLDKVDELRNSSDKVTIDVLESDSTNAIADTEGNNAEKTTVKAEINLDTLLVEAIKAVETAETDKTQDKIDLAQAAINKLKEGSVDRVNLQARIDKVTADIKAEAVKAAIAKINAGTAVVADYTTAGIAGVEDGNLVAVNATITAAKATAGKDLTVDQIQTNVNNTVAVLAETAKITATFAANGKAGDKVVPTVGAGYTIAVKTTSDDTKYAVDGTIVAAGTSNVVYTVTNTASGLKADTVSVAVTVTVTP